MKIDKLSILGLVPFKNTLLRFVYLIIIISGLLMNFSGCSDKRSWDEEVKLLDGRVITVTQTRRYEHAYTGGSSSESNIVGETWLTFKLPEYGDKEIIWHENLIPIIVNISDKKLYIVGWPPTKKEFIQYGKQRPIYIGFMYENNQWKHITFNQIPEAIYDSNMLLQNAPFDGVSHIPVSEKTVNSDRLARQIKRIDPSYMSNWN